MAQRNLSALILALALGLPASAHAYLPTSTENIVRTWFSSGGRCTQVTCDGFDVPADPLLGGCTRVKESKAGGNDYVSQCAPATLAAGRINTYNVDGTFSSADVEAPNSADYGKSLRFNVTTGMIEANTVPARDYLPGGIAVPVSVKTAVLTANLMRCATIIKRGDFLNGTKYAVDVIDVGGAASVCVYQDSDTGALVFPRVSAAPGPAIDTSGAGSKSATGLDAFSLFNGVSYRLCWTSANTAVTLAAAGTVDTNIVNAFSVVTAGNAANAGTTGVCPATTGVLGTGTSLAVPNVQIAQ